MATCCIVVHVMETLPSENKVEPQLLQINNGKQIRAEVKSKPYVSFSVQTKFQFKLKLSSASLLLYSLGAMKLSKKDF